MMTSRRSIFGLLLVYLTVTAASVTEAAPPPPINNLTATANLTPAQRSHIREYAEYWCGVLAQATPVEVAGARAKLLDPLRQVQVGDVFRWEYSSAALAPLQDIIGGTNPHTATNAMHVVAFLGTERALEFIVNQCDITVEKDFGARLTAANCFMIAVRLGTLGENETNRALRRLGRAASEEEKWLVLRRQFEAIASVDSAVSRDVQVNVLRATTQRMAKKEAGPSELMQAVYPALKLVRDEYLQLRDQKPFGKELAPVLCDVCSVANDHWDNAQNDPDAKTTYGGAVHISENLLRLIDPELRPGQGTPKTDLGRSWRNSNKPQFSTDHGKWQVVLRRPPYGKP
ncbi:MAG: hypothetical protein ACYS0G_14670 [Planctomycetota bacterium]|jgi:hypothetical protein